jgi:hypothetical protein
MSGTLWCSNFSSSASEGLETTLFQNGCLEFRSPSSMPLTGGVCSSYIASSRAPEKTRRCLSMARFFIKPFPRNGQCHSMYQNKRASHPRKANFLILKTDIE